LIETRRPSKPEIDPPSIRAAEVPTHSAVISGAWLGSVIPPASTQILLVPAAIWASATAVAALAIPG